MGYAHDYAAAIMHRGRIPMEPADYVPNWQDGPRKAKYHPGADGFRCPTPPTRRRRRSTGVCKLNWATLRARSTSSRSPACSATPTV